MKFKILSVLVFIMAISCNDDKNNKLDEIINVLPAISPFMIKPDTSGPAIWLDRKQADGRFIQEPINLILADKGASDIKNAESRLISAFETAGYDVRYGHTSGYLGIMNNELYPQKPEIKEHTFSDYMWAFSNNHTRIFGPYINGNYYIWIGSSSREMGISHDYISFEKSRDAMVIALNKYSNAEFLGSFLLNNKLDNVSVSTGDHDGFAKIVLIK
jgi:hypothetical protein